MKTKNGLLFVVLLCVLSGCAYGNRYDYSGVVADLDFSGDASIIVAVHDQREYVISGAKNPDFIGLQRQKFGTPGLPYNVRTENGKPLADNIAQAISQSLSGVGLKVTPVILAYTDTPKMALSKLTPLGADRIVMVVIKEWKTDNMHNARLMYDLYLKVFGPDKRVLATKTVASTGQNIGGTPELTAPRMLKDKIEELLNDPAIAATLRSPAQ